MAIQLRDGSLLYQLWYSVNHEVDREIRIWSATHADGTATIVLRHLCRSSGEPVDDEMETTIPVGELEWMLEEVKDALSGPFPEGWGCQDYRGMDSWEQQVEAGEVRGIMTVKSGVG